jgi:transglutaminase-like putative cysteine protease
MQCPPEVDDKTAAGISNDRQKAVFTASTHSMDLDVTRMSFDPSQSLTIPITDARYAAYLDPKPDPAILSLAKRIVGTETNAYKAALLIRQWVFLNIRSDTNSDTPPTPVDTLKAKNGWCVNHAVLYVALAQAAGIPSRSIGGLKYDQGAFWGHEWAESFVGEWVPMDPSFPDDVMTAAYLQLDSDSVREWWPLPGVLAVLECRYPPADHEAMSGSVK